MVIRFLEKYQEELVAEKIDLKEEIDLLASKMKENEKFADILDSTNDSSFSNFTPREVNTRNKEKVGEIKEDLFRLQQEKDLLDKKMKVLDDRLSELQTILLQLKKDTAKIQKKESGEREHTDIYDDLKKQLNCIAGYIISDPLRAKLSIEEILHRL